MLCCVSCADTALSETQNTLKYATRASHVRNRLSRVLLHPSEEGPAEAAKMKSLQQFLDNSEALGAAVPDLTGFGNGVLWRMLRKLQKMARRHRERAEEEVRRAAEAEAQKAELEAQVEKERTRVARLAKAVSMKRSTPNVKVGSQSGDPPPLPRRVPLCWYILTLNPALP